MKKSNPIVQALAAFPYGWKVCVTYHNGKGVHAWQRKAASLRELREALGVAANFRKKLIEKV